MAPRLQPDLIRELAADLGFDLVRFGPADLGGHESRFLSWIEQGRHGEMDWLRHNREVIADPERFAPGARSTISLAHDYGGKSVELPSGGRIARYAAGRDYHRVLGKALRTLRERLETEGLPRGSIHIGTDAVPVLERALAAQSGIGFLAKSAGVISPTHGPYLLLAEALIPAELPFDLPSPGSCGSCTRCLDACPTGAIVAPFEVDARRCISHATIESRGPIPESLREGVGEWLFGCDVCLEVCPFTSKTPAPEAERSDWHAPHDAVRRYDLVQVLEIDQAAWDADWTGTPIRRATRDGLRRNAAVVLGNRREERALPALREALADPSPLVREHSAWAIRQIAPQDQALRSHATSEKDPRVLAALEGRSADDAND